MTPGARVAAAIEIMDAVASGTPTEQALTRWARRSRFAGSKDRAAVRDLVFDTLRKYRTAAHYGQAESGRALLIGALYQAKADLAALFDGQGHAPDPLIEKELAFPGPPEDEAVRLNLPDWLMPHFHASLGEKAEGTALALQERAPVTLRVNLARTGRSEMIQSLAGEGIETEVNSLSPSALTVTEGTRRIRNSAAYKEGLVELQDAASQAVVDLCPLAKKPLDLCAGGGGKALALAARGMNPVFAHDADWGRMSDLPARAERAQSEIVRLRPEELADEAPFDLVLCDVPCSGSGSWRRAPEGKWRISPPALEALKDTQDAILRQASALVGADGTLVYATCSVFDQENEARIAAFAQAHPQWKVVLQQRFDVSAEGDGFFTAHLTRA